MKQGTQDLKVSIQHNPQSQSQFNAEQLEAIDDERSKIPGYTWHFDVNNESLQLVPEEIHNAATHLGIKAFQREV